MRSLASSSSLLCLATLVTACAARADYPERPPRRPAGGMVVTPGPDAKTVAAEVVGTKVTIGELDQDMAAEIDSARASYEMALYEARKFALDQRIERGLLQAEAGKRGMSVEALLAAEVEAKVPGVGDPEVRAFYEQYKDEMDGASYEAMAERLRDHLDRERRTARQRELMVELRKAHGVKVLLDPPRVAVEAKGPARGKADAKVTIVIFSDFECPFCGRAEPTLAQIRETWPDDVRFVFRHYPLPFHQAARPAAAATSCAAEQGKFWELHDQIFAGGELGLDQLRAFLAKQAGFDLGRYEDCLDSGRGEAVVEADMAAAAAVGVNSTPHFFINGVRISGAQDFGTFASIIENELSR